MKTWVLAFQIRDDILDYVGSTKLVGKPLGADIKDKKITLPLIHSLEKASKSEKSEIIKLIKNRKKKDNIEKIIEFVKKYNGIEYAQSVAKDYADKAKESLRHFPKIRKQRFSRSTCQFCC